MYRITLKYRDADHIVEDVRRYRRDDALFQYRCLAYEALRRCAMLDRPVAHYVMELANAVEDRDSHDIPILHFTLTFEKG